jgi:sec-independent protein translocase protein TatC
MSDASGTNQTIMDHLTELRDRLIKSAWAIAVMSIGAWVFSEQILEAIARPIHDFIPGGKLVFLNPVDMFVAHMKVSMTVGTIASCPIWLYQVWRFVAPGLHQHERKYSLIFIGAGTGLFATGVSFAYFLVLPTGLKFLLNFGGGTVGQPMITLPEYLSFFTTMTLVFGASFELPLVLVVLGAFGLIDQQFLRTKRRYAIVILSILAALITPPDVMSMLMLLIPLIALYEISIILVGMIGRKRAEALKN